MSDPIPVGRCIREARLERQLGLVPAGALAHVDPSHWRRVELGQANPSLATVSRMAAAVGLTEIAAFLSGRQETRQGPRRGGVRRG